MAIVLNGTSGITTPGLDNTGSSTLSAGTANGVAYLNGSKVLTTGSALTFNGSNLGLGVTPSAWGSSYKAIDFVGGALANTDAGGVDVAVTQNAYYNGTNWISKYTGASKRYVISDAGHLWFNGASATAGNAISFTQAMTLDASGNLLVGTTSSDARISVTYPGGGSLNGLRLNTANSGTSTAIQFVYNAVNQVGTITTSTTATAYNTSSDYRLKENIQPMQNALAKVAKLNPVTYTWKADGSDGQGFIAHELQAVVPDCVTGEKDAVDKDGNPVYQGVDTSFLVATLTKAIQELTARIEQLEAK